MGVGVVLGQDGYPVIFVSRRLTDVKQDYSQTQRESLAVYQLLKRLQKFLFDSKLTIVTDHEALRFVYHPVRSLQESTAAIMPLWCISLSTYVYGNKHHSIDRTPHNHYLFKPLDPQVVMILTVFPSSLWQLVFRNYLVSYTDFLHAFYQLSNEDSMQMLNDVHPTTVTEERK